MAESRYKSLHGVPFTPPVQWVATMAVSAPLGVRLAVQELTTSCEFYSIHTRCCWSRTELDARTAELARGVVTPAGPATAPPAAPSKDALLALVGTVTTPDPVDPTPSRKRPQTWVNPRSVEFSKQPPPVLRVNPEGSTVYRLSGSLALCFTAPAASTATHQAWKPPVLLSMAPSPGCAAFLQQDPPTGYTRESARPTEGKPQLLLLQKIERHRGAAAAGRATVTVTATYSAFQWLLSPLGNTFLSPVANVSRIFGLAPRMMRRRVEPKRKKTDFALAEAAPAPARPRRDSAFLADEDAARHVASRRDSLDVSFDVLAAVFDSEDTHVEAARRISVLGTPTRFTYQHERFAIGIGFKKDVVSPSDQEGLEQAPQKAPRPDKLSYDARRSVRTEYKRIVELMRFLETAVVTPTAAARAHAPDAPRARLVPVGRITTSVPIPIESCTTPQGTCLASLLPHGVSWPLEAPAESPIRALTPESTLADLQAALMDL